MQELFSAFGIDWKLLVAQTINFLIVFGALTYFLYKPVMRVLSEREAKIAQGVKDAEEAAEKKAAVEAEKSGIIAEAHKESESIVSRAHDTAKKERSDIVAQAQERAESIVLSAQKEGDALKEAKLKESEKEIAQTAVLAAEKLIREKLS